jgi:organic radical activating enzyme
MTGLPSGAPAVRIDYTSAASARVLLVDWELGNTCNYHCSYCPEILHDGSVPWLPADRVLDGAAAIARQAVTRGQRVHVQLSGGEPTLFPAFRELLAVWHDVNSTVGLISNGARSAAWWTSVAAWLHTVTLSFHVASASVRHIANVATILSERLHTSVNVPMLPVQFTECLQAARALRAQCPRAIVMVKPLRVGFGAALYPYTSGQLDAMRRFDAEGSPPAVRELGIRGDMRVIGRDGSSRVASAADFLLADSNHWKGWTCYAGIDLLAIDAAGNVYRGRCGQGGRLGTIGDAGFTLPIDPVTCAADSCHCHSDIATRRSLPLVEQG